MDRRLFTAALTVVLATAAGVPLAQADIYTWVDASGRTNVSNLDPPDGAKVTSVVHVNPLPPTAPNDAAREALRAAEVQALADRVRQLQDEVAMAQRPPPPPAVDYRPVALPPPSYGGDWAPPAPLPYTYAPPQPDYTTAGCDPTWAGCGWYPGAYPTSIIVVRAPFFRRPPPHHGGRIRVSGPPVRMPGHGGRWH